MASVAATGNSPATALQWIPADCLQRRADTVREPTGGSRR
jgi:hypothetical protein